MNVADVGHDELLVHDEHHETPSLAFALSRLSHNPVSGPVPIGVFRNVQRPVYDVEMERQLATAVEKRGAGDLQKLVAGSDTWVIS